MRISDWSSDVCSSDLTVEGEIRAPKDGERYFALTKLISVNFDDPEVVRHRVNFDNLTPLYPTQKLTLDATDPTVKDKSARVIDIVSPQGKGQRALIVAPPRTRSEEHTTELQSLMRISYAVFCLKKKKK